MSQSSFRDLPVRIGLEQLPADASEREIFRHFQLSDAVVKFLRDLREPDVRVGWGIQAAAISMIRRLLEDVALAPAYGLPSPCTVVRIFCVIVGLDRKPYS